MKNRLTVDSTFSFCNSCKIFTNVGSNVVRLCSTFHWQFCETSINMTTCKDLLQRSLESGPEYVCEFYCHKLWASGLTTEWTLGMKCILQLSSHSDIDLGVAVFHPLITKPALTDFLTEFPSCFLSPECLYNTLPVKKIRLQTANICSQFPSPLLDSWLGNIFRGRKT